MAIGAKRHKGQKDARQADGMEGKSQDGIDEGGGRGGTETGSGKGQAGQQDRQGHLPGA